MFFIKSFIIFFTSLSIYCAELEEKIPLLSGDQTRNSYSQAPHVDLIKSFKGMAAFEFRKNNASEVRICDERGEILTFSGNFHSILEIIQTNDGNIYFVAKSFSHDITEYFTKNYIFQVKGHQAIRQKNELKNIDRILPDPKGGCFILGTDTQDNNLGLFHLDGHVFSRIPLKNNYIIPPTDNFALGVSGHVFLRCFKFKKSKKVRVLEFEKEVNPVVHKSIKSFQPDDKFFLTYGHQDVLMENKKEKIVLSSGRGILVLFSKQDRNDYSIRVEKSGAQKTYHSIVRNIHQVFSNQRGEIFVIGQSKTPSKTLSTLEKTSSSELPLGFYETLITKLDHGGNMREIFRALFIIKVIPFVNSFYVQAKKAGSAKMHIYQCDFEGNRIAKLGNSTYQVISINPIQ